MSDLREELAAAFRGAAGQPIFPPALDALLPVVRRYAARELREAADSYEDELSLRERLLDRADALEADA